MASCEMTVFQKALLDSVLMEYWDIPEEHELKDRFSEKFHLWANSFIVKQNPQKVRLRRVLRIALIAAVLMALLAGTVMAIPIVREAIIDYFFHSRVEANGIVFDPAIAETAPETIETSNALAFVPKGYRPADVNMGLERLFLSWENDLDQTISFHQYSIGNRDSNSHWIGVGNPDDPRKQVLIGEYIVDVIDQKEVYSFLWTNNEYFFLMHIPTDIDWDTMVKIVGSVCPTT